MKSHVEHRLQQHKVEHRLKHMTSDRLGSSQELACLEQLDSKPVVGNWT
jgi:hypothetical protein